MAYADLPLDELRRYRPDRRAPADLREFWARTLEEHRGHSIDATATRSANGLRAIETADVTFAGFDGRRVRAWLHRPAGSTDRLPAIVQFHGYGTGRGLAHESILWAAAGYAHLVVDNRGQGWGDAVGSTPDHGDPGDAGAPGLMTRGIRSPKTYYYRRLFVDAVRSIDAVRALPGVDPDRVGVTGASQGGGLALAVAALAPALAAVSADVPFLCDFPRALHLADRDPYGEIRRYLAAFRDRTAETYATLSYFDAALLAPQASAPLLVSVGLLDDICFPSTVYAAFNEYGGPKEIVEYPFNGHEGGGAHHEVAKLAFFDQHLR